MLNNGVAIVISILLVVIAFLAWSGANKEGVKKYEVASIRP